MSNEVWPVPVPRTFHEVTTSEKLVVTMSTVLVLLQYRYIHQTPNSKRCTDLLSSTEDGERSSSR